jgi:hypothetical protein
MGDCSPPRMPKGKAAAGIFADDPPESLEEVT